MTKTKGGQAVTWISTISYDDADGARSAAVRQALEAKDPGAAQD
jgi:hypothetical protein